MELNCCNCGEIHNIEDMIFDEKTGEWYCRECAERNGIVNP